MVYDKKITQDTSPLKQIKASPMYSREVAAVKQDEAPEETRQRTFVLVSATWSFPSSASADQLLFNTNESLNAFRNAFVASPCAPTLGGEALWGWRKRGWGLGGWKGWGSCTCAGTRLWVTLLELLLYISPRHLLSISLSLTRGERSPAEAEALGF